MYLCPSFCIEAIMITLDCVRETIICTYTHRHKIPKIKCLIDDIGPTSYFYCDHDSLCGICSTNEKEIRMYNNYLF